MITALIVGLIFGAIPIFVGATHDQMTLGTQGFILTAMFGVFLGMLGAIPMAAFFVYFILKKDKEAKAAARNTEEIN